MDKLLEVIVTSAEEAREAVAGGADRLELVRDLDSGGLTPPLSLIAEVMNQVTIPVRVMVRENAGMSAGGPDARKTLAERAAAISELGVSGLVAGFVEGGVLDAQTLWSVLNAAPGVSVTFHRAFESLLDPEDGLSSLSAFPQIDRILLRVGARFPLSRVRLWQFSSSRFQFIAGIGLATHILADIRAGHIPSEVHIGRAARSPEATWGRVDRAKVAHLKGALS